MTTSTPDGMARTILLDQIADAELAQKGYVILPLLDAHHARTLLTDLVRHVPCFPEGFYASVHDPDGTLRTHVNDVLMQAFKPLFSCLSRDTRLLGGAFINKSPGARGALPPHQDWNIVDEAQHRSFNIWVPLVATDAANGAIAVIPGSHCWSATVRGPNIPCIYRDLHSQLRELMVLLPMKEGEVLIYDHRLLHCSEQNKSGRHRPAAVMGLVPAEAQMKLYYRHDGMVRRYRSSVEFMLSGRTHLPPDELVADGEYSYDWTPLDSQGLDRLRRQSTPNPSLAQ